MPTYLDHNNSYKIDVGIFVEGTITIIDIMGSDYQWRVFTSLAFGLVALRGL